MSSNRQIGKLAKIAVNVLVTVDKAGKHAVVGVPGINMDDINRVGRIGINRILHWLTSARIAAYHIPNPQTGVTFLEYDKMTSDVLTFMASTRTTVDRQFYSLLDSGSFPTLDINLHLGYVGTSSLNSVATLTDRKNSTTLATNVNQVVVIDKVTRTPKPVPDWWKKAYESAVVENERLIIPVKPVPGGTTTHRYQMTVAWSDTDGYRHTNYQSYVRFCLDAAMDAVDKRFYRGFADDILLYDVKTIESLYAGESKAGDSLVIETWQPDELVLIFRIVNKDDKLIFQSCMEFHSPNIC